MIYSSAFQTFSSAEPFSRLKYFPEPHPFLRIGDISETKRTTRMSWNYAQVSLQSILFQNVIHSFLNITSCSYFNIIVESR
jgi:hypothetical protein